MTADVANVAKVENMGDADFIEIDMNGCVEDTASGDVVEVIPEASFHSAEELCDYHRRGLELQCSLYTGKAASAPVVPERELDHGVIEDFGGDDDEEEEVLAVVVTGASASPTGDDNGSSLSFLSNAGFDTAFDTAPVAVCTASPRTFDLISEFINSNRGAKLGNEKDEPEKGSDCLLCQRELLIDNPMTENSTVLNSVMDGEHKQRDPGRNGGLDHGIDYGIDPSLVLQGHTTPGIGSFCKPASGGIQSTFSHSSSSGVYAATFRSGAATDLGPGILRGPGLWGRGRDPREDFALSSKATTAKTVPASWPTKLHVPAGLFDPQGLFPTLIGGDCNSNSPRYIGPPVLRRSDDVISTSTTTDVFGPMSQVELLAAALSVAQPVGPAAVNETVPTELEEEQCRSLCTSILEALWGKADQDGISPPGLSELQQLPAVSEPVNVVNNATGLIPASEKRLEQLEPPSQCCPSKNEDGLLLSNPSSAASINGNLTPVQIAGQSIQNLETLANVLCQLSEANELKAPQSGDGETAGVAAMQGTQLLNQVPNLNRVELLKEAQTLARTFLPSTSTTSDETTAPKRFDGLIGLQSVQTKSQTTSQLFTANGQEVNQCAYRIGPSLNGNNIQKNGSSVFRTHLSSQEELSFQTGEKEEISIPPRSRGPAADSDTGLLNYRSSLFAKNQFDVDRVSSTSSVSVSQPSSPCNEENLGHVAGYNPSHPQNASNLQVLQDKRHSLRAWQRNEQSGFPGIPSPCHSTGHLVNISRGTKASFPDQEAALERIQHSALRLSKTPFLKQFYSSGPAPSGVGITPVRQDHNNTNLSQHRGSFVHTKYLDKSSAVRTNMSAMSTPIYDYPIANFSNSFHESVYEKAVDFNSVDLRNRNHMLPNEVPCHNKSDLNPEKQSKNSRAHQPSSVGPFPRRRSSTEFPASELPYYNDCAARKALTSRIVSDKMSAARHPFQQCIDYNCQQHHIQWQSRNEGNKATGTPPVVLSKQNTNNFSMLTRPKFCCSTKSLEIENEESTDDVSSSRVPPSTLYDDRSPERCIPPTIPPSTPSKQETQSQRHTPAPSKVEALLPTEILVQVPRTSDGSLTSIGSINHQRGSCKPCVFYKNRGGAHTVSCSNGVMCLFCHLPHTSPRKPPRPSKRHRIIQRALNILEEENIKNVSAENSKELLEFLRPRLGNVKTGVLRDLINIVIHVTERKRAEERITSAIPTQINDALCEPNDQLVCFRKMTDYWVSQERYHCKVCNCWLSNHPRNIAAHEQSARHVGNQSRQMQSMYARQRHRAQDTAALEKEIARIEAAARITDPALQSNLAERSNRKELSPSADRNAETAKAQSVPVAACDPLWFATVDPETGNPLWINKTTGEQRTTDPSVIRASPDNVSPRDPPQLNPVESIAHAEVREAMAKVQKLAEQYRSESFAKGMLSAENGGADVNCTSAEEKETKLVGGIGFFPPAFLNNPASIEKDSTAKHLSENVDSGEKVLLEKSDEAPTIEKTSRKRDSVQTTESNLYNVSEEKAVPVDVMPHKKRHVINIGEIRTPLTVPSSTPTQIAVNLTKKPVVPKSKLVLLKSRIQHSSFLNDDDLERD